MCHMHTKEEYETVTNSAPDVHTATYRGLKPAVQCHFTEVKNRNTQSSYTCFAKHTPQQKDIFTMAMGGRGMENGG